MDSLPILPEWFDAPCWRWRVAARPRSGRRACTGTGNCQMFEAVASRVSVACCIAGAWRDWELSWWYIEPNVVEALNADVYAVSDTVVRTPGTHGRGDPSFTVERMRAVFGRRV